MVPARSLNTCTLEARRSFAPADETCSNRCCIELGRLLASFLSRFYHVRMNTDASDLHFERGLLLYQQDRHPAAEAELKLALLGNPEFALAHAILALCLLEQGKLEAAAEEVGQALRLQPGLSFCHYARAHVLMKQHKLADAEDSIGEALRLDPTDASFYAVKASISLDRRNATAAVHAAEEGLAFDPNHPGCSAIRTMALLRLGRTADATAQTADSLRRDPQDALAHTGRGWALLHEKKPVEALHHFRESLRIDPTNEFAREGLIEALKARYWLYRQMLGFFLWMSRLNPSTQWMVIIGLFVLQRALGAAARNNPALRPFAEPALFALIGFVVLTWIASPLFSLLLRLNRFGRLALSREEIRQSNWIGLMLLLCLVTIPFAMLDEGIVSLFATTTGVTVLVMLLPVTSIFRLPPGWRRHGMRAYVGAMIVAWGVMAYCFVESERAFDRGQVNAARESLEAGKDAFQANLLAGFLSGFLVNGLTTFRRY